MKKVMVIVPFPMGREDLARREAQMKAVRLGPGIAFEYRPVRVGPKNYSSQHDMALADFSILDAGLDAEAQGFDAICIDTMSDSGMSNAALHAEDPGHRAGSALHARRTDARREVLGPHDVGSLEDALHQDARRNGHAAQMCLDALARRHA